MRECVPGAIANKYPGSNNFVRSWSVTAALAVTCRRRGLSMGKPQSVALVQRALLQNLRKSITACCLGETGIAVGSSASDRSICLVSGFAFRPLTKMTVLGRPTLARPVPVIHTTTALRARSTLTILRASEGNNETAPASSKPTIFYGGRSFTESEVAQCLPAAAHARLKHCVKHLKEPTQYDLLSGADAMLSNVYRSGRQQSRRERSQKAQICQTQYQHRSSIRVQALQVRGLTRAFAALAQLGRLRTSPNDACQCPSKDCYDVPKEFQHHETLHAALTLRLVCCCDVCAMQISWRSMERHLRSPTAG